MRIDVESAKRNFEIRDVYNRTFSKLRVSLTNHCNLSCSYCVSGKSDQRLWTMDAEKEPLDSEALFSCVKKIHEHTNLHTIKLTGGEPLLYHELLPFIQKLNTLGIPDISITTNGFFLKHMVKSLADLGIHNINVSLDAATPEKYKEITKKDGYNKVMEGIGEAIKKGINIKLNTVVMKNLNHNQVLPLLDIAQDLNVEIRYLELMKMGYLFHKGQEFFYPEKLILSQIEKVFQLEEMPRENHATARYWKTDHGVKFGIIANESAPFCRDCNRLRLDSYGKIYGCISSWKGLDINSKSKSTELIHLLKKALEQKQTFRFTGSPISMINIGG